MSIKKDKNQILCSILLVQWEYYICVDSILDGVDIKLTIQRERVYMYSCFYISLWPSSRKNYYYYDYCNHLCASYKQNVAPYISHDLVIF